MSDERGPAGELLTAISTQLKATAAGMVGVEAALIAKREGRSDREARLNTLVQILLPATSALIIQKNERKETATEKEKDLALFADLGGLLLTFLAASQGIGPALATRAFYSFLSNYFIHGMYPTKT